jgi:UDP-MurNAc hydroxylase
MQVTLLADSTFLFEHNGVRILTDPWIGSRIYGGAWVQFPQSLITADQIGRLDYVFISHIHQDHCDLETIKQLDKSATIILMKKTPSYVGNFLNFHNLGFESVLEVPIRSRVSIKGGIEIEILEADPTHALNYLIDSSLVLHYENKALLFANDNLPHPAIYEYLRGMNIALAILPCSGGSGYPARYGNLTDDEKEKRSAEIVDYYFRSSIDSLRAINPDRFLWAAGSHVLAGSNANLNRFMAWPRSHADSYRYLEKHVKDDENFSPVLISPGQTFELESKNRSTLSEAISFYENEVERNTFIDSEKQLQIPYQFEQLELTPSVNTNTLLKLASSRLRRFLEDNEIQIEWALQFHTHEKPEEVFTIQLMPPYLVVENGPLLPTNRLVIACDTRLLVLLLTGLFSWNIADASCFLSYDRLPDEFIPEMYILLNHFRI